jgi:hypothetical protein
MSRLNSRPKMRFFAKSAARKNPLNMFLDQPVNLDSSVCSRRRAYRFQVFSFFINGLSPLTARQGAFS